MGDELPLILVCDDTPAKRYVLSSWLRRSGYRVMECQTASDALRLLTEHVFDLAVLDVHLPDGSGLDITRALREDPERASTPVVHVSAVARETLDKVAGLDSGADAYLVDPIDPQELLSLIRNLLRSSGARRDAEELARRMSRLNRAAVRLNVASTVGRLADAVVQAAAEVLEVPAYAVLLDGDGGRSAGAASSGTVDATAAISLTEVLPLLTGLEAHATVHSDRDPWSAVLPRRGDGRWRVWPVTASGETVGMVAVPVSSQQDNEDFLLERLAQLTSVAVDNLRTLEREHQTAMLLQRSLLPVALPRPEGMELAARYRASQLHAEVGGDFFDAFELDGHCFVVIGDVQGHSLEAAVVMAELRYSLRAYAYDGYGPAEIMDRLDTVLVRNEPGVIATAIIGLIDPERRTMRLVSAGHPPAVVARADGVEVVNTRGVLLGLGISHTEHRLELRPGDRWVFMTDGLVERRTRPTEEGVADVAAALDGLRTASAEEAADRLLESFSTSDDDVALLVIDLADRA